MNWRYEMYVVHVVHRVPYDIVFHCNVIRHRWGIECCCVVVDVWIVWYVWIVWIVLVVVVNRVFQE